MGGPKGDGAGDDKPKKPKKPKKDRYTDKEKLAEGGADSSQKAASGTSSMTDVTYTIAQLQDPEFWKAKEELKVDRWKYAPDDEFEQLTVRSAPCPAAIPRRRDRPRRMASHCIALRCAAES